MRHQPYRQGHVLLLWHDKLPDGAQPVEHPPGRVVIAHGESGREHVFKTERIHIFQKDSKLYIEVIGDEPITLFHDEHEEIEVDPGVWEIVEQRELNPEDEAAPRRSFPD